MPTELRFEVNQIVQLSIGFLNENHKYLIIPEHMFCVCIYMIISTSVYSALFVSTMTSRYTCILNGLDFF